MELYKFIGCFLRTILMVLILTKRPLVNFVILCRGLDKEGEESKWSTWLKEAKLEFQEFTSTDLSSGKVHEASLKDYHGNNFKELTKHNKDVKDLTSGQKDESLLQVQPSSLLKRKLYLKNLEPFSTSQTSSLFPFDSGLRSCDEKKRHDGNWEFPMEWEKRRDVKQELIFSKVNQGQRLETKTTVKAEMKEDDCQRNDEEENGYRCQPEDDTEEVPYVGQTISQILKSRGHGTLKASNQQNKCRGRQTSRNNKDVLAWSVRRGHTTAWGLQGEIVLPERNTKFSQNS
jgi:hypothetical protein